MKNISDGEKCSMIWFLIIRFVRIWYARRVIWNIIHFKKYTNVNFQCGMRFPEVNYLPEEHSCWNAIYTRLENIWPSTACKEFLEGHQVLLKSGLLNRDRIPDVSKISKLLESKTGFRLRPATGLCPAREFLACLGIVLFIKSCHNWRNTLDFNV